MLLDQRPGGELVVITGATTSHSAALRVGAAHPALGGHFPGNPIVPAVVVLDAVISAAEDWLGARLRVTGLSKAKFVASLRPDELARIELVLRGQNLEFSVDRDEVTIANGSLIVTWRAAT